MSYKLRHNFPIEQEKRYRWFMTTINTALAFDSNNKAKLKLHVLKLLNESGWKAVSLAFPGVSRATVYRWRKRYLKSEKKLSSLLPLSTKPHRTREMVVPEKILGFIKELRIKYPKLSKYKIKPFLDIYCQENNLPLYSVSWIGKVITRYSFFFNQRKIVRRKRSYKQVNRVKSCPKQKDIKFGYLQLDGIKIVFLSKTYYFLSCIELKSRHSWAKRVKTLSSKNAKDFLESILKEIDYPIHTIQTDNGSEFKGYFDKVIEEMTQTQHVWSFPRSPKTNGYIERFNWTIQDEFINYEIDAAHESLKLFDKKLEDWLQYYNHIRPHQSLNYKTPMQVLELLTN